MWNRGQKHLSGNATYQDSATVVRRMGFRTHAKDAQMKAVRTVISVTDECSIVRSTAAIMRVEMFKVCEDGNSAWIGDADTVEAAQARIKSLKELWPGEYLIIETSRSSAEALDEG